MTKESTRICCTFKSLFFMAFTKGLPHRDFFFVILFLFLSYVYMYVSLCGIVHVSAAAS